MHKIFLITIKNHKGSFYLCFPEHFLLHRFKYSCLIMFSMTSPRQDSAFCQSKFCSDIKVILCLGHCSCNNEVSLCYDAEKSVNFVQAVGDYVLFLLH